jgi:hypothetical protein
LPLPDKFFHFWRWLFPTIEGIKILLEHLNFGWRANAGPLLKNTFGNGRNLRVIGLL